MSSEPPRDLPDPLATDRPVPLRVRKAEGARLYARLLVSNIRLYHEEEVLLGRAARDLSSRLRAQIAAARELYRERYQDGRIFEAEIVRILAGGDPDRLGS